jgi:hypothetical protein
LTDRAEPTRFSIPTGTITWDEIGGEIVAINLVTGHYHALRGSARDVFVLIDAGIGLDELIGMVAEPDAPGADVETDVRSFIAELEQAGLVVDQAPSASMPEGLGALPEIQTGGSWTAPVLETFTDLEDLMLLDPVHDVDDQGWPRAVEPIPAPDVDVEVDV